MSMIIECESIEDLVSILTPMIGRVTPPKKMITLSWFSAGVSSAVATKIYVQEIDAIVYTHIDDQHEDTERFLHDCSDWFEKPIYKIQSKYRTVEAAVRAAGGKGYINGPAGAACTRLLKRRLRQEFETLWGSRSLLKYVWGLDAVEEARATRIIDLMPDQLHEFPLISCGMSKADTHGLLARAGIKRPAMYDMGYQNNNCLGCLKGGRGYWNKIRVDFPEIFALRARLEREVGASCIKGCFLDELPPNTGKRNPPICEECGVFCQANLQDS